MIFSLKFFLHDIERTVRLLRATREQIGALVASNTHENELPNDEISNDHVFINADNINTNDCGSLDESSPNDRDIFHSLQVNLLPIEELDNDIEKLTPNQRTVFTQGKNHFNISCKSPLHIFISGGAGTGK